MLSIPDSFIEAARLDGANEWQIFVRIIAPVSSPILASFAILQFLGMWNSYLWPQVMANSSDVAPLAATLPTFVNSRCSQSTTTMSEQPAATIPTNARAKQLRACLLCSIIQSPVDFRRNGCPNCEEIMQMKQSQDRVASCTTTHFDGVIAVIDPESSWVARWQRTCE